MEDVSVRILAKRDIVVVNRQKELPADFPMTGHIDGEIDGTTIGFEHKHPGRYDFIRLLKYPFEEAVPGYVLQTVSYGAALGWTDTLFVMLAQDASGIRGEAAVNRHAKNPERRWAELGPNPKVFIKQLDLTSFYKTTWPKLAKRARELSGAGTAPGTIRREFDPEVRNRNNEPVFPCSHCEWYDKCKQDGEGTIWITPV